MKTKMIIEPLKIDTSCIEYEVHNEYADMQDTIRTQISKKCIDLEEGFIRDALISIGWTPPTDEQKERNET